MFLVAQMAEVFIGGISQYDEINSQLPHQGVRVLLTGEKTMPPIWTCLQVRLSYL